MDERDAFLAEHFGMYTKMNEITISNPSFEHMKSISYKHRCCYCGGDTTDDRRGNCAACGAPRIKTDKIEVIHSSEKEWTFGNDSVLGINTTLGW